MGGLPNTILSCVHSLSPAAAMASVLDQTLVMKRSKRDLKKLQREVLNGSSRTCEAFTVE